MADPRATTERHSTAIQVLQGSTSRLVPLGPDQSLKLGPDPTCDIRLEGIEGPGTTLTLTEKDGEVRAEPGPAGEWTCNGHPLPQTAWIRGGDVLQLPGVEVRVFTGPAPQAVARRLQFEEFRHRIGEEVDRGLRNHHPLAVAALRPGDPGPSPGEDWHRRIPRALRRVDLVAEGPDGLTWIGLPETGDSAIIALRRLLKDLLTLAPETRVGLALSPEDALVPDALLDAARLAVEKALPGQMARPTEAIRRFLVDGTEIRLLDPAMVRIDDLVHRLATSDLPVLITGETGSGKEWVARAIHQRSRRADGPFWALNCASITETLFESEVFGYERGAFTDARAPKPGLLEAASGGTLLLDEIAECPPGVQAKLLRVLETGEFCRLGSLVQRQANVRILASTHGDLQIAVAKGRFRQDLYYRLAVARVDLIPLRMRPLDIPMLARHFLAEACRRAGRSPLSLGTDALRRLELHRWPGNVRELQHLMEWLAATMPATEIRAADLPPEVAADIAPWSRNGPPAGGGPQPGEILLDPDYPGLPEEIRALEERRIRQALIQTGGSRQDAARLLRMPLRTLVTRLRQYGIDIPPRRARRGFKPGG